MKQTCPRDVNTTEWDVETLPISAGGGAAEIQMDTAGTLHVLVATDHLQYANNRSGSWVVEEKIAEGIDERAPRMAMDACNNIALLYSRGAQWQLAARKDAGTIWSHSKAPLATAGGGGGGDITYDKSNRLQFVGHVGTSEVRAVDALTFTQWGQAAAGGEESADLPIFASGGAASVKPSFFVAQPTTGYPMLIESGNKSSVIAEKNLTKSLAAVVDRFGTVHVAWKSNDTVWYARRQKNEPWSTAEEVVTQADVSRVSLVIGPTLVPYVLASPHATVHMRSTSTWKPSAIPAASQAMAMTIDGSGRLYVLQSDNTLLKQKCL